MEPREITCVGGTLDGETFTMTGSEITTLVEVGGNFYKQRYQVRGCVAEVARTSLLYLQAMPTSGLGLCPKCARPSLRLTRGWTLDEDGVSGGAYRPPLCYDQDCGWGWEAFPLTGADDRP